jgi:hypothetical protein
MRIPGIDKSKPNVEVVIFQRNDVEDIVVEMTAVISYDRFNKLVKEPVLKTSLRFSNITIFSSVTLKSISLSSSRLMYSF